MSSAAAKIAERRLPDILAVVLRAAGWQAVEAFVKAFGGKRIRIPKYKVGDHHPLVAAAGRAAADAVVEAFGNDKNVPVPRGDHSLKIMAVVASDELSTNALAERLGCTYRHAHNLRKEAKAGAPKTRRPPGRPKALTDPRQTDLEDFLTDRR